ncbi:SDR family oxidoreductase [Novosphingobium cyanobacteriorum]|uniref:SDR family NAD(P)-dependent oxidoreductase n=1 Tax=Novosphingobium cyanobacteriorum TaxID=3024215 RepID=A0ABT6CM88_9SPHN|nr:SDR family NAD(P)-dependent oxidoreductase [Novosphingobium cyanobacteriorum]MDF8334921.1 SDR family NAD(P)-dependent oxidoreductase [Novosphingobium cyanobacteriorum]
MDLRIAGQHALVTGAGRGLGRGIAKALAGEGVHVIALDRDAEFARSAADEIVAKGGSAQALVLDITDSAAVREAVARLEPIQILVNCAGFSRDAPVDEMSDEAWQSVLDVCLTGAFYVTRAVVPAMKAAGYGRIVNISSRAREGDRNKVNYAAAKAGLVGLTQALALELGKSGITSNAIAPGFCDGERPRSLPHYAELKERALALTPMDRLGEEADIADAVLYFCARQSGYVTGEVLTVAGGRWR